MNDDFPGLSSREIVIYRIPDFICEYQRMNYSVLTSKQVISQIGYLGDNAKCMSLQQMRKRQQ
jgi:hypothetical protein